MSTEISRRTLLEASGVALTAAGRGEFSRAAEGRLFAYVGRQCAATGPNQGGLFLGSEQGGGIDVFRVNAADGSLQPVSSTGPEVAELNSDGMCTSADGRFLYCVNRTTALHGIPGTGGGVYAFAINRADGSLRFLNSQPSMGAMPTAVRVDQSNSRVIVSNHGAVSRVCLVVKKNGVPVIESPTDSGTVALFPVESDGSLGPALDAGVFAEQGAPGDAVARPFADPLGAYAGNEIGAACHCLSFDRTQRWIIATDNGLDHIYIYPFRPTTRMLEGKAYPTPPGRAPRHIAVHPHAPYFFITNEHEPSVSAFHFDSDTGVPRLLQTIATVPGGNTAAPPAPGFGGGVPFGKPPADDIRMHPSGKFLYSSNGAQAGHPGIALFALDATNGRLTRVQVVETAGTGTREFNIEPAGRFLFTCNTRSNDVMTYALDADTGKMTQTARVSDVLRASVIDFATL